MGRTDESQVSRICASDCNYQHIVYHCFLVHVCVLTPAKLFRHQNEKMIDIQKELEALKKTQQTSISWQPPEIFRYTQNVQILFGGHFEDLNGKTYFGNPLLLDVQKLRDKSIVVPLGNVTASVSI